MVNKNLLTTNGPPEPQEDKHEVLEKGHEVTSKNDKSGVKNEFEPQVCPISTPSASKKPGG